MPRRQLSDMPRKEFIAALNRLGLTEPVKLASALGCNIRTAQRYFQPAGQLTEQAAKLLRAMVALGRTEI